VEGNVSGSAPEKLDKVSSADTPGVGIRGMRERLRQLGGNLEINSDDRGTVVEARLTIRASSMAAA
jgi:signal transduction histidine kinase